MPSRSENASLKTPARLPLGGAPRLILELRSAEKKYGSAARAISGACRIRLRLTRQVPFPPPAPVFFLWEGGALALQQSQPGVVTRAARFANHASRFLFMCAIAEVASCPAEFREGRLQFIKRHRTQPE